MRYKPVCARVCVCVCVCVCVRACLCLRMCVSLRMCVCVTVNVCLCPFMCVRTRDKDASIVCLTNLLDASSYLYERVCPSVGPSVGRSVHLSVRNIKGTGRPGQEVVSDSLALLSGLL